MNKDNSVTVLDNGRGIPTGIHPKLRFLLCRLFILCFMPAESSAEMAIRVSGGLHGVGAAVVNALSEWMEVEVSRDCKVYKQCYEKG